MIKKILSSVFLFGLIACVKLESDPRYTRCPGKYHFADQTDYVVHVTAKTSKNIEVDTSGLNINLNKVDRLTDEVESCLIKTFGNPPFLSEQTMKEGQCASNTFDIPIHRECLVVKVASDWFLSKYEYGGTHHQQLPWTNGGQCTNKGLPAGVCYYRVGIQDDLTIVVPPSFYLYKDGLVRIVTGCANPWYANDLAACMEPTTNPLGDGSEP